MKLIYFVTCLFLGFSAQAAQQTEFNAGSGRIEIQNETYSIDFGTLMVNQRTSSRFTLRNVGNTPLVFVSASISGMDFSGTHGCRAGLLPNETCSFTLNYWPMFEGTSTGRFVLNFTDDQVVFSLWGRSTRQ